RGGTTMSIDDKTKVRPRRQALGPGARTGVLAACMAGRLLLLFLLGEFAPGSTGSIARAMTREALAPQTAAVAIAVMGLNIHFGCTGLLNIGLSGFMLLGAYGFAIPLTHGVSLPLAVLCGLLAAVLFAVVLGV